MSKALRLFAIIAALALMSQAAAAATKTYQHPTHYFSFAYPDAWTIAKKTTHVVLAPPASAMNALKAKGVRYTLTAAYLNADSATWTPTMSAALKSSWTKFVTAYGAAITKRYGVPVTAKTYGKSGWTASVVTWKTVAKGVTTIRRVVLMTKDRKKAYAVSESWTKNTASPFASSVKTLVKSFGLYSPNPTWSFDGANWKPSATPPACDDPFVIRAPVDLTKASSVLYPGQSRGGQYKPHGGFRLDGQAYDSITITAPFDAYVIDGSRHYEGADIQYYFDFIAPCGIRYRLDHLHTLSPTMAVLADQLPAPTSSSVSYPVTPTLIKAGTVIATAVGHPDNVGFDLGVYDLRQRNAAAQSETYQTAHADMNSNAYFAVCWFDWLTAADEATVRALPPGDGVSGAASDYCQ